MKASQKAASLGRHPVAALLLSVVALVSCGGGSGDDSDATGSDSSSSSQQYPGGVWTGTSGTSTFFGVVDPGTSGTGGFFYFAKGGGTNGYDGIYGSLATSGRQATGSGVTYYAQPSGSTSTGTFTTASRFVATVANMALGRSSTSGTMSGSYTVSSSTSTFSLAFNHDLSNPSGGANVSFASGLQGYYSGATTDGSGWGLYIDWNGRISGRNASCLLTGTATPRTASAVASGQVDTGGDEFYDVSITLSDPYDWGCKSAGTVLSGLAVVHSTSGSKDGIWLFARNTVPNTFVLNGSYAPLKTLSLGGTTTTVGSDIATLSSTACTSTLPTGIWSSVSSSDDIQAVVLPSGSYFLYRNGNQGDIVFGSNLRSQDANLYAASARRFLAEKGIYYERSSGDTWGGITVRGDVCRTSSNVGTLYGLYDDPSVTTGIPSAFKLALDAVTTNFSASSLLGTYTSNVITFGGSSTVSMTVAANASNSSVLNLSATMGNGCAITATISSESLSAQSSAQYATNMYAVSNLTYAVNASATSCSLSGGPTQSGILVADTTDGATVSGIRILTAGTNSATSVSSTTVLTGTKQ